MSETNNKEFVTQVQFAKGLTSMQSSISDQVNAGFERISVKMDALQKHTDDKIDTELSTVHRKIEAERADHHQAVEKLRDERRIGMPIILGIASLLAMIIAGLGGWMLLTASSVSEQQAVADAIKPYEAAFKTRISTSVANEDSRNDKQDAYLATTSARVEALIALVTDEVAERKALELRHEEHASDGHPRRVETSVSFFHAEYLRELAEIKDKQKTTDANFKEIVEKLEQLYERNKP